MNIPKWRACDGADYLTNERQSIHHTFFIKNIKNMKKWNVKPCILIKFFDWYMNVHRNKMKEKWDNKWFSWTRNLVDFIIIHNLFYFQFRISVYCIHNFILQISFQFIPFHSFPVHLLIMRVYFNDINLKF